jgi:two-component system, chemotaxis family, chemotaxis protein CheY
MRAIVIDDSRATRAILRRMLVGLGFEVAEAADGRQGLEVLDASDVAPDVVLVDWNMPVMDGLEFVRSVRADPDQARLTLLMVTTEGDPEHMLRALEAGVDEYVMKPFTESVIREKLQLLGVPV